MLRGGRNALELQPLFGERKLPRVDSRVARRGAAAEILVGVCGAQPGQKKRRRRDARHRAVIAMSGRRAFGTEREDDGRARSADECRRRRRSSVAGRARASVAVAVAGRARPMRCRGCARRRRSSLRRGSRPAPHETKRGRWNSCRRPRSLRKTDDCVIPAAAYLAIVPPTQNVSSSGCAKTQAMLGFWVQLSASAAAQQAQDEHEHVEQVEIDRHGREHVVILAELARAQQAPRVEHEQAAEDQHADRGEPQVRPPRSRRTS